MVLLLKADFFSLTFQVKSNKTHTEIQVSLIQQNANPIHTPKQRTMLVFSLPSLKQSTKSRFFTHIQST